MSCIELKNVCLDYLVKTGSESIKKTAIHIAQNVFKSSPAKKRPIGNTTYRALNNINFELKTGDRVGLIGRNGAGKSTLLKVLAKIYKPTCGSLEVNGRISSLFDINLGMNPEATGFENIIHFAIMKGFSKQNAKSIIGEIEAFTEMGDVLDRPFRTYSAGMQMKLAFAVATAIQHEIMLIDEIIGVGDSHFMKKATERLESMIDQSQVMVLTSHSNDIIKKFCNKVILLNSGVIEFIGDVNQGIEIYTDSVALS